MIELVDERTPVDMMTQTTWGFLFSDPELTLRWADLLV